MDIETIVVSPLQVNCYLVWSKEGRSGVIIDPGDEDERIVERIDRNEVKPAAILLTHGHADHIGAVEPLKRTYDIPLYIGREDEALLSSPSANVSAFFGYEISCPPADQTVADGDNIRIGGLSFTILATPGHTPGGVCYYTGRHLFCGDTLFMGSIGRTDLPGGDSRQLIKSIEKNILSLPDETICYPGHGPVTSVGRERTGNPFLTGGRFA